MKDKVKLLLIVALMLSSVANVYSVYNKSNSNITIVNLEEKVKSQEEQITFLNKSIEILEQNNKEKDKEINDFNNKLATISNQFTYRIQDLQNEILRLKEELRLVLEK